MTKFWEVLKDIAIIALLLIAFAYTFKDQWDKAAFYMSFATYAVLVRRENDI